MRHSLTILLLFAIFTGCSKDEEASTPECGQPVSYQGYDYQTVLIGDQCWFAENLRSEDYRNGDPISSNLDETAWGQFGLTGDSVALNVVMGDTIWVPVAGYLVGGALTVYGEAESDCEEDSPSGDACEESWSLSEYGRLYNFFAVDDNRGLCPNGWHVANDGEWMAMESFLGMSADEVTAWGDRGNEVGIEMKAPYGWSDSLSGSNSSGFSALPGGVRGGDGGFYDAGKVGAWWCSDTIQSEAIYRAVDNTSALSNPGSVLRSSRSPTWGLSIRCIKDAE